MAHILEFRDHCLRVQKPSPCSTPQGPAQLYLFTGVRYERRDEPAAKTPSVRNAGYKNRDARAQD